MKIYKFTVDENHARTHNEYLSNSRYFTWSGILLGIMVALLGIWVYLGPGNQAAWAMMLAIVAVVMGIAFAVAGIAAGRQNTSAQVLYDRYPLMPAVVVEVSERHVGLLGLANTNADPALPPRWALVYSEIKKLPHPNPPKVGNQVPAAAVLGRRTTRNQDVWQSIDIMPIAWATPDADVINQARRSIPPAEWNKLDRGRDRLAEVKGSRDNLLVL